MLPSMPVIFSKESQDAFQRNNVPSTSKFNENYFIKTINKSSQIQEEQAINNEIRETDKVDVRKELVEVAAIESEENNYDNDLATSYYNKVQTRFGTRSVAKYSKFTQFQELLKGFDPTRETPIDLYTKIKNLFGEENKDLVEEFLLFLTPGQAAEIGRFMDHFMLTKMTNFLDLLQSTFARKPTMLRKIMRAITNSMHCGSVKEMKSKVLPHLRSSPRLTSMYKSLFPDELPSNSSIDSNTNLLTESFLTDDRGYDVWEYDEPTENRRNLRFNEGLDTKYLQGRVFLQYGKMLKMSKVTFPYSKEPYRAHVRRLAPAHCRLSPSQSDEEDQSPQRNNKATKSISKRAKKTQTKTCAKNLKDVNDNTKQTTKDSNVKTSVTDSPKTTKSNKSQNSSTNSSEKFKLNDTTDKRDAKVNKNTKEKKDTNKATEQVQVRKDSKKERLDSKHSLAENRKEEAASKAKRQKLELKSKTEINEPETKKVNPNKKQINSWTRDEDKTMLQILQEDSGSDMIFCKIREFLPHRTMTEIQERFSHVMNLLQKMALGEVT